MAKYLLLFDFALLVTMIAANDFEPYEDYDIAKMNRRPTFYGTHWWDRKDDRNMPYVPFIASIRGRDDSHCTGAVIHKQHIITTATCCFKTIKYTGAHITVAGIDPDRVHISYDAYFYPPDYNESTKKHDVCVIHLEHPLRRIKPIKLPSHPLRPLSVVSVFYYTSQLKMIRINNYDKRECQRYFPHGTFDDDMLCAGGKNHKKGACDVPQGGLLIGNGVLYGLASWSLECTTPDTELDPMVFTDLWAYDHFIKNALAMNH